MRGANVVDSRSNRKLYADVAAALNYDLAENSSIDLFQQARWLSPLLRRAIAERASQLFEPLTICNVTPKNRIAMSGRASLPAVAWPDLTDGP
jgi:hypothetical protein